MSLALSLLGAPTSALAETQSGPPELNQAPAAQPSDRKDGAGAAAAMAAVGAGIAALSCAQLYKAAQEIEPVDPAQAAQLRAMAAQQCAQAAQDAGNAAQNQNSKDTLAKYDSPKLETAAANNNPTSSPAPQNTSMDTKSEIADAQTNSDPNPSVFDSPTSDTTPTELQVSAKPASPITALEPIDPSRVAFDESTKGGPSLSGNALAGNFSASLPSNQNGNLGSLASIGTDSGNATTKERKRRTSSDDSNSSSGSSESSAASSGGNDVGGMFARLMGGDKDQDEQGSQGVSGEIQSASRANTGKTPNIFEYASYRFKKARNDELLKFSTSKPLPVSRSLASVKK